jgi:hypothetical protein
MQTRAQAPNGRPSTERPRRRPEGRGDAGRDVEVGTERSPAPRSGDRTEPAEGRRVPRSLPAAEAAEAGIRLVTELTGRTAQGVVSLDRANGGWLVGVEVVEDRRVPSSADVLALYEIEIDGRADLVRYARKRRYARGKGDSADAG